MMRLANKAMAAGALAVILSAPPTYAIDPAIVLAQADACRQNCTAVWNQCHADCRQERNRCVSQSFGNPGPCFDQEANCQGECGVARAICINRCR